MLTTGVSALLLVASAAAAQAPGDTTVYRADTLRVEVARLRAAGIPVSRLPFAAEVVTSAGAGLLEASLPDLLGGVTGLSTASQFGSPAQHDLRFRGFQVGPVVGFPQSVSVFVDGVRVNEPDASQVNFDLIPMPAVERVEVIRSPGGPFGRNTLAGAINLVTRRGDPDAAVAGALELAGGSFGTGAARAWAGGSTDGGIDYVAALRWRESEGWRALNRSALRTGFAKLGYRGERTDAWLSYTVAHNHVEGPGSLPSSWLDGRLPAELRGVDDPRRLQFTGFQGDWFEPRLHFAVLNVAREMTPRTTVQLNGFVRSNEFQQVNDNITEPNARGVTDILSIGATAQAVHRLGGGLLLTGGLEGTRSHTDIAIFEEPNPAFPDAGGMTESVGSVEDAVGAFGHVWWPLGPRASLSGSLRFDYVFLPVTDRLDPDNSGENTFRQLTGSLGGDLLVGDAVRVFAGYGRGFRAPVILEVSCADPLDPCPLPFELGADPPLDPVVTDTWQAGLRYVGGGRASLELVGFWAEVYDDLFAVVAPSSTRGYFRNLDRTRRQGLELTAGLTPAPDLLSLRGTLALTRATFQSTASLASALVEDEEPAPGAPPDTAAAPEGAVVVGPGDHFAMVPRVTASLAADLTPGAWRLGLEAAYVGAQYFLGDEWNREEFGRLPAYFLVDAGASVAVGDFDLFARIENLLDSEHNTFGMISANVRGPEEAPQPFLTPGLPRHGELGLRYRFRARK